MNALAKVSTNQVGMVSGNGSKIAPQSLGEVVRFAEVMAGADIALPKHLRSNVGACLAVAMQALEWEMSPFAVASKSYSVNGTIAYEAQLIAAVVNTRSGIKGRLKYQFSGEGDAKTCTVTGILDGEEYAYTSPKFAAILPKNSPLWKTDPEQQLGYYSARAWARRYTPEVLLGVYDRDEAAAFQGPDNAKDVTPPIAARMQAQQQAETHEEGFSLAHVEDATEAQEIAEHGASATDGGEVGTPPSTNLGKYAKALVKALRLMIDQGTITNQAEAVQTLLQFAQIEGGDLFPEDKATATTIYTTLRSVIRQEKSMIDAVRYVAGLAKLPEEELA